MNKRNIYILIGALTVAPVGAETLHLICSYSDLKPFESSDQAFENDDSLPLDILPLRRQYASEKYFCNEYKHKEDCESVMRFKNLIDSGRCLKQGFSTRMNFRFEEGDLKQRGESNVEYQFEGCGYHYGLKHGSEDMANASNYGITSSPLLIIKMISTPSVISFKGATSDKFLFNINRETLKAGYGVDRSYQCEIKKIKRSKNQL